MTKEEAIQILKSMSDISTQGEALDMAIEALQGDADTDGDCISRTLAMNAFERKDEYFGDTIHDILSDIPSACRPHGALIEARKVYETIGKWTTTDEYGNNVVPFGLIEMLDKIPTVESVVRCKDCIYYETCNLSSSHWWKGGYTVDIEFCSFGERREP